MAKKITVGELARQAQEGFKEPSKSFDARRLLFSLGFGLSLATAALCLWQAFGAYRTESAFARNGEFAEQLAAKMAAEVGKLRTELNTVADGRQAYELVTNFESFDGVAAKKRVLNFLPSATDADLIQGDNVLDALGARMSQFGFAKSDVLLEAEFSGKTVPAHLHNDGGKYFYAMAAPIKRSDTTFGYLLAKFPVQESFTTLRAFNGPGNVSLIQKGLNGDAQVFSLGDAAEPNSNVREVPGSKLALSFAGAEPFKMLPLDGVFTPLLCGLLSLGMFAGLSYARSRPSLFADVASKLTSKPDATAKPTQATPRSDVLEKQAAQSLQAKLSAVKAAEAPIAKPIVEAEAAPSVHSLAKVAVARSMFRAYDIRGVVGDTLNEQVAELLGRALGSEVIERGLREMVVARDGRLSGPSLSAALIRGLQTSGCNVIDLGAVPTPVLYFATYELNTGCGVMVTGSHNPPDYNGFKMMIAGQTLAENSIQALYQRIEMRRFTDGPMGSVQSMDVSEDYIDKISGDIQLETPLRVVVDSGNGIAGAISPKLLQSIGCEVEALYCDVDGTFPNHHPDPSDPANLRDLKIAVKQMNADIGVAFDGDGDRLGVVTRSGKIIYPDRLLILFARDLLTRVPGASIIYDVKCTGALAPAIRGAGGVPVMYKTGHSLIKGKMKEIDAALAGEMSGHFFFKERWLGFDDGLYAACRLLEILAASGMDADDLFDEIPDAVSTPELKIQMKEGEHYRFMERFAAAAKFEGARLTTIDGVRADYDSGWGLVRCSNTTPCLVLRFEGESDVALKTVQEVFRAELLKLDRNLKLPF